VFDALKSNIAHAFPHQARRFPCVSLDVWDEVEDMTEALRKMQEESSQTEDSDQEEDS